jgi:hypothetical protein
MNGPTFVPLLTHDSLALIWLILKARSGTTKYNGDSGNPAVNGGL